MNFLAHFHLAWPDAGLVAGGLEGDFCKGPLCGKLEAGIERGVKLHRAVDAFTDNHPLVAQLRTELPSPLRRYAGILIDLSFDHYLTIHWSMFSALPLAEFNRQIYSVLQAHERALSPGSQRMVQRLIEHDILGLYHNWDTVPASAARIGQRFSRFNPFLEVDRDLAPMKKRLEEVFLAFYPQLIEYSAQQERQLNQTWPPVSKVRPLTH
tara:strand:+ start:72340 stop:72969 length:630 start_codon:yes stop_codon:yes gene_type:complete